MRLQVKPNNKKYKQGVLNPKMFKKCNSNQPIIYRSGLELKFIHYLENNNNVITWDSECINIPYVNPIDKKEHNYYPDFIIKNKKGIITFIEIKPFAQTIKPINEANNWSKEQWIKNTAKWKATLKYVKERGYKFIIVTEKFFEK